MNTRNCYSGAETPTQEEGNDDGSDNSVEHEAILHSWLSSSPENEQLYNRLRGVAMEYVEELRRVLGVKAPGLIPVHMVLLAAGPDAPSGAFHIDGVTGGILLIVHLTCCAPCTLLLRGQPVTVEEALKFCAPELVRLHISPPCPFCSPRRSQSRGYKTRHD